MNKLQEDILAFDRLALLYAGNDGIHKQADLAGTLSGLAKSIYDKVSTTIDTSSTGSTIQSTLRFLEPGVIFMLGGPLLAAVDAAAQIILGWSVTDAVYWIVGKIKPMLMSGQPVSGSDVDAAAAEFAQKQSGDDELATTASNDCLRDLRAWNREGFINEAQLFGKRRYRSSKDPLAQLFLRLGGRRAGFLGAGLVGLIIKVVLISGGLLIGGGMIADWLGISHKPSSETTNEKTTVTPSSGKSTTTPVATTVPATAPSQSNEDVRALAPSGAGEISHPNTDANKWFVPLVGDNLVETLMYWVDEIYPQFSEYDRIILEMPSFRRVYDQFNNNYDSQNPGWVAVPTQFKKRVDVIKPIITETYNYLKSQT